MAQDSEGKRGGRRPRRDRDRDRDRNRERDPAETRERIEKEFSREIEMRISYFLNSGEQELELEAMNSYRRRLVHTIAKNYQLQSESRGDDRERYVCLIKTPDATPPPAAQVRLWDYGQQTFPVKPGSKGVHMALKVDGSVEIFREAERGHVLADRVVTTNEFRVRHGKILLPGEPDY